jgi:hypothetical protein
MGYTWIAFIYLTKCLDFKHKVYVYMHHTNTL